MYYCCLASYHFYNNNVGLFILLSMDHTPLTTYNYVYEVLVWLREPTQRLSSNNTEHYPQTNPTRAKTRTSNMANAQGYSSPGKGTSFQPLSYDFFYFPWNIVMFYLNSRAAKMKHDGIY